MKPTPRQPIAAALLAGFAFAAFGGSAAALAQPQAGRHTAELCVATLPEPIRCGPAQADVHTDGMLRVRVDDIAYNLRLLSSQVEVVVMHNLVQIDAFTVPYAWVGPTLRFDDDDRHSRYEVRFSRSKSAGR